MKYEKTMILLVLVVFLLGITCVSASEIDNAVAREDTDSIKSSADNDVVEDYLQNNGKKR